MIPVIHTIVFLTVVAAPDNPAPNGVIAPRPTRKVEAVDQYCTGTVLEVTRDSITIRPDRGGLPRRFAASAILAAGDYRRDVNPPCMYKLADVTVGDYVGIDYDRIDGVDVCYAVGIRRRPGGRIPPGHYPPDLKDPPHERAQAYQDFEEQGIPLPAKYQPVPPLLAPRVPVAPMPRAVKPLVPIDPRGQ